MNEKTPLHMAAVQLVRHGGLEALCYREDISTPVAGSGEVLIKVAAAGINNTDINTRIGWYSKKVRDSTSTGGETGFELLDDEDAAWSDMPIAFPRIQGADCCGVIVATGEGVSPARVGERVIVRSMMHSADNSPFECQTFGSECDGAFAQYTKAPSVETHKVDCFWSDAELASIPCAYSTAENMLHRASVGPEHILITGASGGVGSAAVQLAKRRGAHVTAVASASKTDSLLAIGADEVIDRNTSVTDAFGTNHFDVVIDLVAGPAWPSLLEVLKRGGRYAAAGAIAGPLVELDVRTLYLKDLTLIGCTFQENVVFENLVRYIERGEIRPIVAKTFPLSDICRAQVEFLEKKFTGKLVLLPPP